MDEYIFHCRPNLISRSEYGAMFPATADGIAFSRATRTGKLRLISSGFILQYVMIPKLSGGKTELASRAQSLEWRKVFKSARSGYTRGIHAELYIIITLYKISISIINGNISSQDTRGFYTIKRQVRV